jgi:hypothetical protein
LATSPAIGEVLADIMRQRYIAAIDIARELGVSRPWSGGERAARRCPAGRT